MGFVGGLEHIPTAIGDGVKKTIELIVREATKKEVEVEFPIFRYHGDEGWDSYTRIDHDLKAWTITERWYGAKAYFEFEAVENYRFDGSSPDYHLGRGIYKSSSKAFYSALARLKKAIDL